MNTILDATGPQTVDEIHKRAQQEVPRLGIATVYRTVKLLLAQERIVVVDLPGEEPHYEPAGRGHHHHFHCMTCHRWFELPTCLVPHLDGSTLREGFHIEGHHLTLYGCCPTCTAGKSRANA